MRQGTVARGTVSAVAAVAAGGAVGSLARYGVALALPHTARGVDWGGVTVNVVGCFVIGLLMVAVTEVWRPHRLARPFLGVGVLGGFTTFSTAAVDTVALLRHGAVALAALYYIGTAVAAVVAAMSGTAAMRMVTTRRWRR